MTDPEYSRPVVISSDVNPEAASNLAKKILSGEDEKEEKDKGIVNVPYITAPPDTLVTLPGGGIMDADGTLHDEAEVRELTGEDEEALSRIEITKGMARYLQTLVRRGVVRIGKYEKLTDQLLGELLIGDREMLVLAIRQATYGKDLKLDVVCPSCGSAVEATYDLATEIPIKHKEDPTERRLTVELRNGRKAVVQVPTAADQDAVLAAGNKTPAEINTLLLARVVVSIDGQPAQGVNAVRGLGMQDRKTILESLADAQPGPNYEGVTLECPACGKEFPLNITLAELFRG